MEGMSPEPTPGTPVKPGSVTLLTRALDDYAQATVTWAPLRGALDVRVRIERHIGDRAGTTYFACADRRLSLDAWAEIERDEMRLADLFADIWLETWNVWPHANLDK